MNQHFVITGEETTFGAQTSKIKTNMEMSSNEGDECGPLSGKPFFDVIISKSHLHPLYSLNFPSEINKVLPPTEVPTVILTHRNRKWNAKHRVTGGRGRFDRASWKQFVADNRLKEGDGLVFEVMECTKAKLEFKVHILRDDIPPETVAKASCSGGGEGSDAEESVIIIR